VPEALTIQLALMHNHRKVERGLDSNK